MTRFKEGTVNFLFSLTVGQGRWATCRSTKVPTASTRPDVPQVPSWTLKAGLLRQCGSMQSRAKHWREAANDTDKSIT